MDQVLHNHSSSAYFVLLYYFWKSPTYRFVCTIAHWRHFLISETLATSTVPSHLLLCTIRRRCQTSTISCRSILVIGKLYILFATGFFKICLKSVKKEWPEDFEEELRTTALPTADLAADLTTQVQVLVHFCQFHIIRNILPFSYTVNDRWTLSVGC